MTCPHRVDVAAYVLDALEPQEFEQMHDHLSTCPDCRPEYDDLRGLPVLLGALTPADVEDIVAPAELPETLCDELIARAVARRRTRNRNRLLGITVAVLALVVGIATGAAHTGRPPSAPSVTVSATDPHTHVHASITLTARDWGTQIGLRLSGVAWAQQCRLVVGADDGRQDTAATWVADYQGALDITGSTAIPTDQIRHLDIVTLSGQRLVSVPPPH
jgi:hypothetical protein